MKQTIINQIMALLPYDAKHHDTLVQLPDISVCRAIAIENELNQHDLSYVGYSYDCLNVWLERQYHIITRYFVVLPYTDKGEPYKNSNDFFARIETEKTIYYLQTANAFGNDAMPKNHPMLNYSNCKNSSGQKMLYNDVFRVVHDVIGHYFGGFSFSGKGEYNATLSHLSTLPVECHPALLCEAFCQTCFFEFGSHLLRFNGTLPKSGDVDFMPRHVRPFAEQKCYYPTLAMQYIGSEK